MLQASKCMILLASVSLRQPRAATLRLFTRLCLPVLPHRQAASRHNGISGRFFTQHCFLCFFLVSERSGEGEMKVGGERRK